MSSAARTPIQMQSLDFNFPSSRIATLLRRPFRVLISPCMRSVHETPTSPFHSPNLYQPSLVASSTPSNPPESLFRSLLCGRCHLHRCRSILTSGEEFLAILELCTCSTNPSTWQRGLCRAILANGMQIGYAGCDRSRMGNEGIAFFRLLWACCHGIAAR